MKSITFPLGLPEDLYGQVKQTARDTKLSMADAMRQGLRLGLPALREKLAPTGRVTNVDPLPEKEARDLYRLRDDDTESIDLFMKAQAKSIPE